MVHGMYGYRHEGKRLRSRFTEDESRAFSRALPTDARGLGRSPSPSSFYFEKRSICGHDSSQESFMAHSSTPQPTITGLRVSQSLPLLRSTTMGFHERKQSLYGCGRNSFSLKGQVPELPPRVSTAEAKVERVLDQIYPKQVCGCVGVPTNPRNPIRGSFMNVVQAAKTNVPANAATKFLKVIRRKSDENVPATLETPSSARNVPEQGMMSRMGHRARDLLIDFQKKCVKRYGSIPQAIEHLEGLDIIGGVQGKSLPPKEWNQLLCNSNFCSYHDARLLFDTIDENRDGELTLFELQCALETISPIHSIEDFRRRLLVGASSIIDAMHRIEQNKELWDKRLGIKEFSDYLSRAQIYEPTDIASIFNCINCDSDNEKKTITINESFACIAALGPMLLLEDVNQRLMNRYGSIINAWEHIMKVTDGKETLTEDDFKKHSDHLLLTQEEVPEVFRLLDISFEKELGRYEFVLGLHLSAPNIALEKFRRRIRLRLGSIHRCLKILAMPELEEKDSVYSISVVEMQEILEPAEVSSRDTKKLFQLIDIFGEGSISIRLFRRGLWFIVPTVILEKLARHLTDNNTIVHPEDVTDIFTKINFETFMKIVHSQKGSEKVDKIFLENCFSIVSGNLDGLISWNEISCAMKSSLLGSIPWTSSQEREFKCFHAVRQEMAPFKKACEGLKVDLRRGVRMNSRISRQSGSTLRQSSKTGSKSKSFRNQHELLIHPFQHVTETLHKERSMCAPHFRSYAQQVATTNQTSQCFLSNSPTRGMPLPDAENFHTQIMGHTDLPEGFASVSQSRFGSPVHSRHPSPQRQKLPSRAASPSH